MGKGNGEREWERECGKGMGKGNVEREWGKGMGKGNGEREWGIVNPKNSNDFQFVGKLIISDNQTIVRMLYLLLILFQTSML